MPSFSTICRALVMVAAGVVVTKGWQLYGPSNQQLKAMVVEAVEMAQSAWQEAQQAAAGDQASADPRSAAAAGAPLATGKGQSALLPAPAPPALEVALPPIAAPTDAQPSEPPVDGVADGSPSSADDPLPRLVSRLKDLGVSDVQLAPWGTSGQLYRFCCRAALAESSSYARHFEAVAEEPVAAVEQVLARVEAWRDSQRQQTLVR